MTRDPIRLLSVALFAAALASCTSRTPEQQLVHEAAEALGGVDRVQRAAGVLVVEGSGRQFNLGQDLRPGLAGQTFAVSAYTRAYDLGAPRMRVSQTDRKSVV